MRETGEVRVRGIHLQYLSLWLEDRETARRYISLRADSQCGESFLSRVYTLFDRITHTPSLTISLVAGEDSICRLCQRTRNRESCSQQHKLDEDRHKIRTAGWPIKKLPSPIVTAGELAFKLKRNLQDTPVSVNQTAKVQ